MYGVSQLVLEAFSSQRLSILLIRYFRPISHNKGRFNIFNSQLARQYSSTLLLIVVQLCFLKLNFFGYLFNILLDFIIFSFGWIGIFELSTVIIICCLWLSYYFRSICFTFSVQAHHSFDGHAFHMSWVSLCAATQATMHMCASFLRLSWAHSVSRASVSFLSLCFKVCGSSSLTVTVLMIMLMLLLLVLIICHRPAFLSRLPRLRNECPLASISWRQRPASNLLIHKLFYTFILRVPVIINCLVLLSSIPISPYYALCFILLLLISYGFNIGLW